MDRWLAARVSDPRFRRQAAPPLPSAKLIVKRHTFAASGAQQAAIAVNMKKEGKKPKNDSDSDSDSSSSDDDDSEKKEKKSRKKKPACGGGPDCTCGD